MNRTNQVNSRQDEVIDEFDMFSDWMEKYEHIIEIGKDLSPMEEDDKVDENLIKGCQSRVWLSAKLNSQGEVIFSADSDAIITKGLVALMVHILSGCPSFRNCDRRPLLPRKDRPTRTPQLDTFEWACFNGKADEDVWACFFCTFLAMRA